MKICIIGYSGSGKSELAEQLSHLYEIPVLHLDELRDIKEKEYVLNTFIHQKDWIVDGNYYELHSNRFDICDEIYFLDYNRFYCYLECFKRFLQNFEFQKWILTEQREQKIKEEHYSHLILYGKRKYHFKNKIQLKKHLNTLKKDSD